MSVVPYFIPLAAYLFLVRTVLSH